MKTINIYLFLFVLLASCGGSSTVDEQALNDNLVLGAGSYKADMSSFKEDTSITLTPTNTTGTSMGIEPGQVVSVDVPFTSNNKNIMGTAIRFGTTGPLTIQPVSGVQGKGSGTMSFNMRLPADICNKMSTICHNIKCYEYAVTSIGTISKANVNNVALMCGKCDEPSCKGLVNCNTNGLGDCSFKVGSNTYTSNECVSYSTGLCSTGKSLKMTTTNGMSLFIYNYPTASSGTYNVKAAQIVQNTCELYVVIQYNGSGAWNQLGSLSGTLTKTGTNSLTLQITAEETNNSGSTYSVTANGSW